jgi:predicted small secreted protein
MKVGSFGLRRRIADCHGAATGRLGSNHRESFVRTEVRLWLGLAILLIVAPILTACNTVRGVGQDVSAAGRGIAHTAEKVSGN